MNKTKYTLTVLVAFLFIAVCATAGQAQAQRTFVAGPGIGNDANNTTGQGYCSFTNPCRNFSVAYGVTNVGGEIIAISPGVGYGGLTIGHAITVTGLPGQVAFVAVPNSSTGFTVSAGASEQVIVQNITFNGSNAGSNTGLSHTSGKLIVKNCNFVQLNIGVATSAKMELLNSDLANNGTAVQATGDGADTGGACPACFVAGQTSIRIAGGNITNNTLALSMVNPGVGSGGNKINIWLFSVAGGGGTYLTNFADNVTFISGSGTGCGMGQCTQAKLYFGTDNPR